MLVVVLPQHQVVTGLSKRGQSREGEAGTDIRKTLRHVMLFAQVNRILEYGFDVPCIPHTRAAFTFRKLVGSEDQICQQTFCKDCTNASASNVDMAKRV
jgi:hypothetical protein